MITYYEFERGDRVRVVNEVFAKAFCKEYGGSYVFSGGNVSVGIEKEALREFQGKSGTIVEVVDDGWFKVRLDGERKRIEISRIFLEAEINPDNIINRVKEFCNKFCIMECSDDCPLFSDNRKLKKKKA